MKTSNNLPIETNKQVKIEVSARHIHLKRDDFEKLFGTRAKLTVKKELSQPGMFAANETVEIRSRFSKICRVRIVGPLRPYTQAEISKTEAINLKVDPPLRKSGDIKNTPGIVLVGQKGEIEIKSGVIIAKRHIHMTEKEAKELSVKEGDLLKVKTEGERGLVFENVLVRIDENFSFAMHIDTDEGNAAGIMGCVMGKIV